MAMSALVRGVAKNNNAAIAGTAKVKIRRNVLAAVGAERAHVLDAYAGDGHMYRSVWREAATCIGCDKWFYPDERTAYVTDNRRLMRMLDLSRFNIFDLDAYGSPWEQLYIVAVRRALRPGERIGIILTEGQGMKLKMGGMSLAMSALAGIHHYLPGLGGAQDELIERALQRVAGMMNGTIAHRWEASGKSGSAMRYIGLVIDRKKPGSVEAAGGPAAEPEPPPVADAP